MQFLWALLIFLGLSQVVGFINYRLVKKTNKVKGFGFFIEHQAMAIFSWPVMLGTNFGDRVISFAGLFSLGCWLLTAWLWCAVISQPIILVLTLWLVATIIWFIASPYVHVLLFINSKNFFKHLEDSKYPESF